MTRPYAPRLATVQRAASVARLLGISGWHLLPPNRGESGVRLYWRDCDGLRHVTTLQAAERLAAERIAQ